MTTIYWIWPALGAGILLVVGYLIHRFYTDRIIREARAGARRIVEESEREAEAKRKDAAIEARELSLRARTEAERETRELQREIHQAERRVLQKEEQLARRLDQLDRRESEIQAKGRELASREHGTKEKEDRLAGALEAERQKLEMISGLTAEEAKRQLLAQVAEESRREATLLAMRLEEEAREAANQKAKEILATTIQRLAPEYTVETAVSILDLPSDDMKGRIIGREGRNIRALELATGVDIIVDDTPEAVIISAYDPLRREIARLALQRLVADGRIHPARIEEVVEKVKKEMEQHLKEEGEKACFEVGVHGLHSELVRLVGRLKYRTSYGQNCL
ncbi:MAG: DUF3552 domain-containing protein, partial [Candidatus Rokubacteria bacterium]|nr:DUF3552 domain-containing protein [Candidatus Rokubacteria bacterium]